MQYQYTQDGMIKLPIQNGAILFLPPKDNGTPEWREYLAWLAEGNEPLPADEPPASES